MHPAHARYAATASDDALIARHAPAIERAARRLAARTAGAVAAEDLWSAGAVGLLEASRRFDAARDVQFEQFAEHRIRGAMLDELRRMDHLPRRLRADLERVERARARLAQTLGREPDSAELAGDLAIPLEDLHAMQQLGAPHLELGASAETANLASGGTAGDEAAIRAQTLRAAAAAVAQLPERLRLVLSLHYEDGLTYREIARILGVSEPRVCQLHGDAMKLLRGALGGQAP
jgi:RNA polymerase sigma factor for flagellar operon FliA